MKFHKKLNMTNLNSIMIYTAVMQHAYLSPIKCGNIRYDTANPVAN